MCQGRYGWFSAALAHFVSVSGKAWRWSVVMQIDIQTHNRREQVIPFFRQYLPILIDIPRTNESNKYGLLSHPKKLHNKAKKSPAQHAKSPRLAKPLMPLPLRNARLLRHLLVGLDGIQLHEVVYLRDGRHAPLLWATPTRSVRLVWL